MSLSTTTARRLLVVLAAALALALGATTAPSGLPGAPPPAVALDLEVDSGVFPLGTADVAKAFKYCRYNDEEPKLVEWKRKEGSPGLGLPDPGEKKNAWWGIDTPVTSVAKGEGRLIACGFLTAMVDAAGTQLGAACGASKGWNGIGTIDWTQSAKNVPLYQDKVNGVTQLEDIGWKVSVGGTLPVTANMVDPKDKDVKIGFLEATVQALGGIPCTEKGPGQPEKGDPKDGDPRPEQGANTFQVTGVYEAVRHHGKAPQPEELKKDDPDKKEPHEHDPEKKEAHEKD